MKKSSLIASFAIAGLLVLPGGAMASSHAPKNDGPKGNAYGKIEKKINKKAKKKCQNKKGKAKRKCVKNTKRKAYGNVIKNQCGVSFGQLRKMARKDEGHPPVTPSKGAKWFVLNHMSDVCENGEIIVPEAPAEE